MDYFIKDTQKRISGVEEQLSEEALSNKDRQKLNNKLCDLNSLLRLYNHIGKKIVPNSEEIIHAM